MDLEETEARNDCAGEGQQQFNRPTGALKDRSRDRRLAVGRRGLLTGSAVPARRKAAVIKDRRFRRDNGRTRNATTA
jgi:hypothetical protein